MKKEPIVDSILNFLDLYKFTMNYFVKRFYPDANVRYEFTNRTWLINLPRLVPVERLENEFAHVRKIGFTNADIELLKGNEQLSELFPDSFFDGLLATKLPPISIKPEGMHLRISTQGAWKDAIWWETIVLAIINELYCEAVLAEKGVSLETALLEGRRHLEFKVSVLKRNPDIFFAPFGTRRHFSSAWEKEVHEYLLENIPEQVHGLSNVGDGLRLKTRLVGTNAHELSMILLGITQAENTSGATMRELIISSQKKMLSQWWELYGDGLSIALPDTYGSDFFLEHVFTKEQAQEWRGLRQDSGDPYDMGVMMVNHYERLEIDPKEKLILFSDGLNLDTILDLYKVFSPHINTTYGWGSNLTNDLVSRDILLPGSFVMKPTAYITDDIEVPLGKLSDNPAKATGDKELIAKMREAIKYQERESIPVVY